MSAPVRTTCHRPELFQGARRATVMCAASHRLIQYFHQRHQADCTMQLTSSTLTRNPAATPKAAPRRHPPDRSMVIDTPIFLASISETLSVQLIYGLELSIMKARPLV